MMPPQSDRENENGNGAGMRRVTSTSDMSVGSNDGDMSADEYRVKRSSLIGYVTLHLTVMIMTPLSCSGWFQLVLAFNRLTPSW
jgi:hypothetical protein